ncbi:MAG: glycine zipper 2TM domain-containing protein [Candidatus Nitrotoga sp.]|nr:glycine zipper 2TM domain-containing protein [Candidatus Nitrotoga sp.]MDP1637874.1 glycine zipper 2TM domain-containing protein [Candidatus Nitrotoga sp.]MDP1855012.1 glycine zipper 2TM domain-containing protein [Candidatus Nitrotoga sp.]MDP3497215.1 glycine zipper 2TM domain-containing protein [Candidatus Nitrotoga sp.]
MKSIQIILISAMAVATLLGGCANSSNPAAPTNTSPGPSTSSSSSSFIGYGVVEDIETVQVSDDGKNITGAVIGGVVGGLLGHQVGSGKGQTAATVAGVVGGAMAGREIEKRSQAASQEKYRVRVRLSNGTTHTVTQNSVSDIKTGDRVRVDNDRVSRAD